MQDVATKSTGGFLEASDWNTLYQEMKNIIETAGITLSGSDEFQNAKGVATYAADGDFYIDTGAADAYVLSVTSRKGPPAYTEGMRVRFKAANSNTGASTVNLTALGIKTIKKNASVDDLVTGDIVTGNDITLVYDSSAGFFNLEGAVNQATTTTRGIVELATQAEVNAGTDTTRAIVPDTLMNATRNGKLNYVGITSGSASTYTLTPSPAYSAYGTGMIFLAKVHADNTVNATLNVNGLGAKKMFLNTLPESNGFELQSIGANHAYWFFYESTLDGGNGAFWVFASRFATQSEVDAGTTVSKFVSPSTLKNYPGAAVAWLCWNQTADLTASINESFNITSISAVSKGIITVNFSITMANTSYAVVGAAGSTSFDDRVLAVDDPGTYKLVTSVRIKVTDGGGSFSNENSNSIVIFGELA